jgi:photosystem II stability/assembly factor-like uncharacterized protein
MKGNKKMLKRSGKPAPTGLKCKANLGLTGLKRSENPDLSGLKCIGNSESTGTIHLKVPKIPFLCLMFCFSILFNNQCFVFSQGGDAPLTAYKWYYCPRAYPFDTIPGGAYEDAIAQREALLQSTSYQSPGNSWISIGPQPFGYGIMSSGRIHHVVYDPGDTSENGDWFYVTGASGGLWKTIDGGLNWQNKSGNLPTLSAGAFAISYVNDNKILYFGSGALNYFFGDGLGMRIFKSTDDGEVWTSISSGIKPGTAINKIIISPNDSTGNTIFAATFHGLYKTTNGGSLWTKILPEEPSEYLICSDVCFSPDGSRVYAVGPSAGRRTPWELFDGIGYWRSDDRGSTFSSIPQTSGFPHGADAMCERTLCAVSKASDSLVWIISFDTLDVNVDVYKSTNYGQNFTSQVVGNNGATRFQLALRPSDTDPDICFAGSQSLFRTTNGGTTNWDCVDGYCGFGTHPDFLALDFNPFHPEKITAGNDGGVFRSDNLGINWATCNQNIGSFALLWGLASSAYDAGFIAGGLHDYGYGYNTNAGPGSTYWSSVDYGADGGNMTASPFKSKHFVGSKVYGRRIIHYSYNGTNFDPASGYFDSTTSVEHAPFTHHPTEPGVVYTVRYEWVDPRQVYFCKSTDYGATWGGDLTPWRQLERPTSWENTVPYLIAISPSNPDTMIMDFSNQNEIWLGLFDARSRLVKSTDGGLSWEGIDFNPPIVTGGSSGTPNRSFTAIEFDPLDPSELYLTVSGYYPPFAENEGHVFRSTDGGYNWANISGSLPDIPVNDIMIHYTGTGANDKELIIATDAGIYVTKADEINWKEVALGFPNTPAFQLDYNRLYGKLRVNTWGRGAWEYQLDNTIYVQDRLYITDNVILDKQIVVAPGGKLIIGHSAVNNSMAITFNNGANIIVEDGGTLDVSSNVAVTLTSSGTWGGIEFQGTGAGTLKNCTFQNTSSPIVIESSGSSEVPHPEILINNCTFYAPVDISNRPNVTVSYCNFSYSSGSVPSVLGVASSGSDDVLITNNIISSGSAISSTGISIVYGSDVVVQKNEINNMAVGISISNTSPFVFQNRITNSTASDAIVGIGFDNSYSATVKQNSVLGYQIGYKLYYSSPLMYEDSSYNTNTSGDSVNSLHAVYISNPRLKPDDDGGELIWDAGKNMLKTTAKGNGIYMYISSIPDIDYGYNEVYGYEYYLFGDGAPFVADHYARCNDWVDDPPDSRMFNLSNPMNIIYEPYGCTPPGGSGFSSDPLKDKDKDEPAKAEKIENNPPQNIIVSYGGGVYDTVKVTSRSFELSMDQQLYGQGVKEELLGNFGAAVTKYKSVIENYQDSIVSINAMKKILICHEKMNADTAAYDNLRNYYLNLIQSNPTDTAFVKAAKEQAIKTLVKKGSYSSAISQYEDIVSSSSDPYEILCSELNIIETYMIMIQEGDAPGFTGRLANLKPLNSKDGHKMLLEKLYNLRSSQVISVVPKQFSLSQNYPNPFNPLTKINYSLPNSVKVTIVVYDILGRVVKSLVNEFKEAGAYSVTFDGTGLASGVYFYRIEAGDFAASRKMVLVK